MGHSQGAMLANNTTFDPYSTSLGSLDTTGPSRRARKPFSLGSTKPNRLGHLDATAGWSSDPSTGHGLVSGPSHRLVMFQVLTGVAAADKFPRRLTSVAFASDSYLPYVFRSSIATSGTEGPRSSTVQVR